MLNYNYISLYNEINIFCLIVLIIIDVRARHEGASTKLTNAHTRAIIATCVFVASDALWVNVNENFLPKSAFWLMALKSIYFFSTTFMCYCWFLYFEMKQGAAHEHMKRIKLRASALVVLHLVLLVANVFQGFFFYVDDSLVYHRGPLFAAQYLLSYSYVIMCCGFSFVRAFKEENYANREQYLTLALFPVPPAICGVIQYFNSDLPCACCGMTISALIMYLNSFAQLVSRDPLTGLNNRRQMLHDIDAALATHGNAGSLWLMMCDLDHFKEINDRLGHAAGDHALEICGAALKRAARTASGRASIYRFGGDEFVMLIPTSSQKEIEAIRDNIRASLDQECKRDGSGLALQISLGYAPNVEKSTTRSLLKQADAAMYNDKQARRAARK